MEAAITVSRASLDEKVVMENLFPLYLHDLSEFYAAGVDDQGRFLAPGALDAWWERDALFPFLIRVDGRIAGFALVCSAPHVSKGREYRLNDFFILRKYRRRGVGREAAVAVFDRFRGAWEVGWIPANLQAERFWRRVVAGYTDGRFEEGPVMESEVDGVPGLYFSNV